MASRCDDPMVKLNVVTTSSLQQALARRDPNKLAENAENAESSGKKSFCFQNSDSNDFYFTDAIEHGTPCLNNGCAKVRAVLFQFLVVT